MKIKKNKYTLPLLLFSLLLVALIKPNQVNAEKIIVTGGNFEEYFEKRGNASIVHDTKNDWVEATLTENAKNQSGSFYLNQKISPEDSFLLEGSVFLGTKPDNALKEEDAGGDGIGFAFYPGEIGQHGFTGAGVGISGIKNAIGFKFDTYYNTAYNAIPGAIGIGGIGYAEDWPESPGKKGKPFGGFLTTNDTNGYATNLSTTNKYLEGAGYPVVTPDADYVPVKFVYTGGKPYGTLTVIYGNVDGVENVDKLTWCYDKIPSSEPLAFHIAGSTGAKYNKQSFIFKKFEFEPDKSVTVKNVWDDDDDKEGGRPTSGGFTVRQKTENSEFETYEHYAISFENLKDNTLTTMVEKLPKRDDDGNEYTYDVVPDQDQYTDYHTTFSEEDNVWTFTHTFVGHIELNQVPETLNWTDKELPQQGDVLSRNDGESMTVSVKDTRRNKTAWDVSASVQPTEGNEDFSLFSLLWKNSIDAETVDLDGQSVLSSDTNTINGSLYSKEWSNETGVLLRSNGDLTLADYSNKLKIRWTLNQTPDVEE